MMDQQQWHLAAAPHPTVDEALEISKTTSIVGRNVLHSISLNPGLDDPPVIEALYLSIALRDGLNVLRQQPWPTDADSLDPVVASGKAILSLSSPIEERAIVQLKDGLALLWLSDGRLLASIAAKTRKLADATLEAIRLLLPEAAIAEETTIRVTFHTGGGITHRRIAVPSWPSVRENYPGSTQNDIEKLITENDRRGGKLILWHGLPGTGKTYALRALGWEWRTWCDLHYIVDPDVFFGDSGYMLKTLVAESHSTTGNGSRWRLFVAEDTGELLAKDAKERTGQGLSRLLNIVDGLIGQGLQIMVLITTNERLSAMHEAVVRPGRCSAPIEFHPFPPEAANAWLAERGKAPLEGHKPRTLAELYAGTSAISQPPIGFAPEKISSPMASTMTISSNPLACVR